ncbi:hypothetical protein C8R46DRAFT_1211424 [Mycena filopes]|nr:hypothetical protein C8R46DRAFT_1211424 [Mycena filopes]
MPASHENTPPHTRAPRNRRLTEKLQESRRSTAAKARAIQDKKNKIARRRILRERQNESNLVVDDPEDSPVVQELRAALARTRGERDAAEATIQRRPPSPRGPPSRSIARPSNMSKVTVSDIRDHLDLAGSENDKAWNDLRTGVCRFIDAGMLNMSQGWKAQETRRLIKVYDAIEEAYPDLERFSSRWATAFLTNPLPREQRLEASRLRRIDDGGFGGTGPRAPSHSPTPPLGPHDDSERDASPPIQDRLPGSTRLRSLTPLGGGSE